MTDHSEHITWPPNPQDVEALLGLIGTEPEPVEGANTSQVWRVAGHDGYDLVVRIAAPDVPDAALRQQVASARALAAAGVPFANPRTSVIVPYGPLRATVWEDLGPSSGRDYEAFGAAVRALHDLAHSPAFDRADVRDPLLDLPDVVGLDTVRDDFHDAASSGLITVDEAALILPTLTTAETFFAEVGDAPVGLVHDDLWDKNVVFTGRDAASGAGAFLIDPDNLAWGLPESDLAFITRALAWRRITEDEAFAFESGYGADLPDLATAQLLALPHRLRWILTCARRRPWSALAAEDFGDEILRHTHGVA